MTVARMEGTMEGWWAPNTLSDTAIGAHWLTFLALLACTVFLAYESFAAKGPSGREKFFAGYHEQYNLALYVNLMASLSYFAKVVSDTHGHNFENVGPFIIGLGNYKYADYMLTCPLLVMDLLFQLRAPYKVTGAVLIFAVLFCGAITNFYPGKENQQAALAWFGMGVFYYCLSYFFLGYIVSRQYRRLEEMAMGTEAKKALGPLRLAITVFFTIWVAFPAVWIVSDRGFNVIDASTAEVLHCIADLIAKSLYGFALARFRRYYDKKMFEILENLGYDGEEAIEELENEMRHMDKEEELEKQAVKEDHSHHVNIASRTRLYSSVRYGEDDDYLYSSQEMDKRPGPKIRKHGSFELPERTSMVPHSPVNGRMTQWVNGHVGHVTTREDSMQEDEIIHNSPRGPRMSPRREHAFPREHGRDHHRDHPFQTSGHHPNQGSYRDYRREEVLKVRNPASKFTKHRYEADSFHSEEESESNPYLAGRFPKKMNDQGSNALNNPDLVVVPQPNNEVQDLNKYHRQKDPYSGQQQQYSGHEQQHHGHGLRSSYSGGDQYGGYPEFDDGTQPAMA